jgi:amidase
MLSPVDVLKAQIARIESHDHVFNAVTCKYYQEALAQAKESERRYRNGNPRLLEGLTCVLKDEVEVKGWRMTMGSLIRKNILKSAKDSALTTLLRDAGIIMHIQTNVPEYYCNLVTWNWLFGISRNPWNLAYTPGGSSGGSAGSGV